MKKQKDKKQIQSKDIVLYKSEDGITELDVRLEEESVWLTQDQIATLFDTQRPAITKHLNNIFKSKELVENSVRSILERTAKDGKKYKTKFYNLDAILSVGYRVNSTKATQFRIWSNKILKEYSIKGYSLNEKKLKEQNKRVRELEQTLTIFSKITENYQLNQDEFAGILKVITDYTFALDLLDDFDNHRIKIKEITTEETFKITYKEAANAVKQLKNKFGGSNLFGKEKDDSFKSSVGTIYQTFEGKELYPSIEEKAAHLLYFIVKNHSFIDGNKRIGAFIFLWFLERNKILYKPNGYKRIADNALVALTLLIAESNPKEKETIIKVVVNLINKTN